MKKNCKQCHSGFEITDDDKKFYEKISPTFDEGKFQMSTPTLCPACRMQRRMSWRTREYFFRPCAATQKNCLSIYPPDAKVVTYSQDVFFGDTWDGLSLGREFDFNRPFFDQFNELYQVAPKNTANTTMNENCEYVINAHQNKDCYLADEIDFSRDCMYGYNIQKCSDILNGFYVRDSQLCYEIQQAQNCYEVFYSHNVFNCNRSAFLKNCRNTRNSLFCVNLRGAEYCIFNKKVSKEEFETAWNTIFNGSSETLEKCKKKFAEFISQQILPSVIAVNTENSHGDYLFNTKNCHDCYNIDHCQDCRYCTDIHFSRDAYDVHIYEGELMYECLHAGPKGYNNVGVILCWFSSDIYYCCELYNCSSMFGCSSLKKKRYCVLNKQYTKEEYEKLVAKIIAHMQKTGEWGEFFPSKFSPYGYSQTMAAYYQPLEKDAAVSQGFYWRESPERIVGTSFQLPDLLSSFTDDMLQGIFHSSVSQKPYKILAKELAFHKKYNIPLPRVTPQERLMHFIQQNPRNLSARICSQCKKTIQTTVSSNHKNILCEECYASQVA